MAMNTRKARRERRARAWSARRTRGQVRARRARRTRTFLSMALATRACAMTGPFDSTRSRNFGVAGRSAPGPGPRPQLADEQVEKRSPGGGHLPGPPEDGADLALERALGRGPRHQGAGAHLGGQCGRREEREPEARLDRALDGLDVVELHHVADPHPMPPQQTVDEAASGNVAVEADEGLAVERGEWTA